MSYLGVSGPDTFVKDPAEMRFYADVLAEHCAEGPFKRRRSYLVLRSLSPQEFFDVYKAWRDGGNPSLHKVFAKHYFEKAGESASGPLFEGDQS